MPVPVDEDAALLNALEIERVGKVLGDTVFAEELDGGLEGGL